MYLRTQRQTRRGGLGDWTDIFPSTTDISRAYRALSPSWTAVATGPGGAVLDVASNFYKYFLPAPSTPSGGTTTYDALLNATTGKPTQAQIDYNANKCIQSIQQMRALAAQTGSAPPPAGAEDQCRKDQAAFVKLIGGTAEDLLANVVPSKTTITVTAILVLVGLGGAAWLYTRR